VPVESQKVFLLFDVCVCVNIYLYISISR
jgi:hypothetical protein